MWPLNHAEVDAGELRCTLYLLKERDHLRDTCGNFEEIPRARARASKCLHVCYEPEQARTKVPANMRRSVAFDDSKGSRPYAFGAQ